MESFLKIDFFYVEKKLAFISPSRKPKKEIDSPPISLEPSKKSIIIKTSKKESD